MARSRLFVTCLSAFIVMLGVGIIVPLLPTFAEDLGASGLWIGIIFSAYSFSRLMFLPLAGKLSDIYGRKIIISVGLLLYALVSIFYIFAQTPEE
ncbi:MAG: MFS transporter, partial [Archaeoglobaceae archaeon]